MKTNMSHPKSNFNSALASVRARIEHQSPKLCPRHQRVLRLALNEAESIAWQTGFPQLVFPVLAKEKAEAVAAWSRRQNSIRHDDPCVAFAA